jgi:alpha-mannosidase
MPVRKTKDPERSPDLPHNWIKRHLDYLSTMLVESEFAIDCWEYKRSRLVSSGVYENIDSQWNEIRLGQMWGGPDTTCYFHRTLEIPQGFSGGNVYLQIDMDGGETQLSIDGLPWQGLDCYRNMVYMGDILQNKSKIDLTMEAFIINYPYDARRKEEKELHLFRRCHLVTINKELEELYADLRFIYDAYYDYFLSDENLEIETVLCEALTKACRMMGPLSPNTPLLKTKSKSIRAFLNKEVFENPHYLSQGSLCACGHSHLDVVYLWPEKETFRKNCRTVTNMLSLMREYPDFVFSASQSYLYEKLKEMYPDVYALLKQKITEGSWEVTGSMYVEPDGNIPGAESLVRQVLFGKRFFKQEFGIDTKVCWLPDVFGVMYTLPQILKQCGVEYFSTTKLTIWNDSNEFPHNTFRWRGLDGSEIISHFPATHFATNLTSASLRSNWKDFKEKTNTGKSLFLYGYADGGGGPTREMVQNAERGSNFPGLPKVCPQKIEDFFVSLELDRENLPIWDDELYLEAHRGSYTSRGDLKRSNRKAEYLFRNAEILASIAWLYGNANRQPELNIGWKLVLLNQFHDNLPGTHVPECDPDIFRDYRKAFSIGNEILEDSLNFLADRFCSAGRTMLFNTLSWERSSLVCVEYMPGMSSVVLDDSTCLPLQIAGGKMYFPAVIPSMGWTTFTVSKQLAVGIPDVGEFDGTCLKTTRYELCFGNEGQISKLYDRVRDRQVLQGYGNLFKVYEDYPGDRFSAWDIAYHIDEYEYPVRMTDSWALVANGPYFIQLQASWKVLDSTIKQTLCLYSDSDRIDFFTECEWKDSNKLVKAAFALNIRSRRATYDLPFGVIERPTHQNTSWDQAKFEVCGHQWADVSESDYGIALLNDSKYGYDVKENIMRLSLLRTPVKPHPTSDLGRCEFKYSLFPHEGSWQDGAVDKEGYEFNIPTIVRKSPALQDGDCVENTKSMFSLEGCERIIEALKHSEDGDDLIIRSYDKRGSHGQSKLHEAIIPEKVVLANLMEEKQEDTSLDESGTLPIESTPFGITTHRMSYFGNEPWKK